MGKRCANFNSHQQVSISPVSLLTDIEHHNVLISQLLYCFQSSWSIQETLNETTKQFSTILSFIDHFLDKQEWVILVILSLLNNKNDVILNRLTNVRFTAQAEVIVKVQQEIKTENIWWIKTQQFSSPNSFFF